MYQYVILVYLIAAGCGKVDTTSMINLPRDEVEQPKTCIMERTYKMLGYVCSNLNLREIPQNLKSGVEVFDVSTNRIRELTQQSFARYSDLKYLYLFDNMIQFIEKDTFSHLTSLEALDLSTNVLRTIPPELFRLPLLRNLYVHENTLVQLETDLETIEKPITAPLQMLNIANSRLTRIPNFGVLPELWKLNVSSNDLTETIPQDLSPYCNLKTIDINNTRIPPCICQSVAFFLKKRAINIQNGIHCDSTAEELIYCPDLTNSTNEAPIYYECTALQKIKKLNRETKITWLSIAGGLVGFFVVFMGVLYYFHRRNVRKTKEALQIAKLKQIHNSQEYENREVLLIEKT